MRKVVLSCCALLATCGWLAWSGPARAEDRSAKVILAELDKVQMPSFDMKNRGDTKAINDFVAKRQAAMETKAALIRELVKVDPENDRLPPLLNEHWQNQMMTARLDGGKKMSEEIDSVISRTKDPKVKVDGTFWKTVLAMQTNQGDPKATLAKVDEFIRLAPKDERGAMLLSGVASQMDGQEAQTAIYKRVLADYPDSQAAKSVEGTLKRLDGIGKPFDLEFTDAVKGTQLSMKDLRGKVVVVDFWATWCGPCVAEMPNMKKLYEEYRGQGVEFIGVSLDQPKAQGGLDALKEFVAKNEIKWPQYYQGDGWQSKFSMSWGINSIPAVFVIDQDGKLYSVAARGKLESMIPELLKKGHAKAEGN